MHARCAPRVHMTAKALSFNGTLETCRPAVTMSTPEGSSEVLADGQNGAIDPKQTFDCGA
jgi:hypothetical protein